MRPTILLLCGICLSLQLHAQDSLDKLAVDFWTWRAQYQPFSTDDIPRIERPNGLKRSWSAAAVAQQKSDLAAFESRWQKLDSASWPTSRQVDYQLIGSALARVHWELDLNCRWQRDPTFYLEQTLTAVTDLLLPPPPFEEARARELIVRLENIPPILDEAKVNLQPAAPFANLAIESLADVRSQLATVARDVASLLPPDASKQLAPAIEAATKSLESYRAWLQQRLPSMTADTAVGRTAYFYFFQHVALYPFTPEELLAMARQEWARSVAFEQTESQRNQSVPALRMFPDINAQVSGTRERELQVRAYLPGKGILTLPLDFPHYTIRPLPAYLAALGDFDELDDFTGPSRLAQDCVRWTANPSNKLGYFALANAHDPRPDLVHEGLPGHYLQLWLGWRNPDPIRSHYYDSGANEGLGFYAEEMMLQEGLFDDSPHSREIIYNFARLRALRVEVDVKLALGEFTLEQAADYLARMVPMDKKTAHSEASLFATTPGQAISYQAGKLQIIKFLADARRGAGDKFDLRAFNDFVWQNGNVPIELQRKEYFAQSPAATAAAAPSGKPQ
jgi:uncharacterized protein (DUF885 family)